MSVPLPSVAEAMEFARDLSADCHADRCLIVLRAEVERLRKCRDELRHDNARLRTEIARLHAEKKELAATVAELREHEAEVAGLRDELDSVRKGSAKVCAELRAEIAQWESPTAPVTRWRPLHNVRDEPRAKRVSSGPWLGASGASATQDAEPTPQANDHP